MTQYGLDPPPPPPLQPDLDASTSSESGVPPRRRRLRALALTLVAVVVGAAAAGGFLAFRLLHGSGDTLISMVPADTAIYVNVNFDPSAGQKLAMQGLISKFPALSDQSRQATIDGWLDTAFASSGLNHNDIGPWLGSDISVAVPPAALSSLSTTPGSTTTRSPNVTVLVASRDDGKAQAALDKLRTGPTGRSDSWTTSQRDGVTVTAGNAAGGEAYALANHTVILASNVDAVDAVIDTIHGKGASLESSSRYKRVESELPGDRLGLAYVDVPAIAHQLTSSLGSVAGAPAQLDALAAYQGVGVALVASSDGITLSGTEDYDSSKLTPDQRSLLSAPPHSNGSLALVPRTAYGFFAFTGLQQTVRGLLTTLAPAGSPIDSTLQQFGITGPDGIIGHLSGDAGIEVDHLSGGSVPAGAVLFATDSSGAAQNFLRTLVSSACSQSSICDPAQISTEVDQGVTISALPVLGTGSTGIEPSWAVSSGWVIIGSSPAEVRAVLDGHASGSTITASPNFSAVAGQLGTSNNGMFYLDIQAVVSAVRGALPPEAQAAFDRNTAPYLNPFRAVGLSERNASDHATFALFALMK